jgi:hypothetical protein
MLDPRCPGQNECKHAACGSIHLNARVRRQQAESLGIRMNQKRGRASSAYCRQGGRRWRTALAGSIARGRYPAAPVPSDNIEGNPYTGSHGCIVARMGAHDLPCWKPSPCAFHGIK